MKLRCFLVFVFGVGMFIPPSANAEGFWLVVAGRNGGKRDYGTTSAVFKVPMTNEMECEAAGLKIMGDQNIHGKVFEHVRYSCLKGK